MRFVYSPVRVTHFAWVPNAQLFSLGSMPAFYAFATFSWHFSLHATSSVWVPMCYVYLPVHATYCARVPNVQFFSFGLVPAYLPMRAAFFICAVRAHLFSFELVPALLTLRAVYYACAPSSQLFSFGLVPVLLTLRRLRCLGRLLHAEHVVM